MRHNVAVVILVSLTFFLAGCSAQQNSHSGDPNSDIDSTIDEQIVSGGVPKDGIPSIDNPSFIPAKEASLSEDDIVFGVYRNGTAKAYPQNILVHHEIVNDQINGDNISVTYCPLTGTAMGFHRGNTTLGVSGKLLNSNLIMYDRATNSYFPQIQAQAINGERRGEHLDQFRVVWTTWGEWKQEHPKTTVLSEETGFLRDYTSDPYGSYAPRSGYYEKDNVIFPTQHEDDRLDKKHVVHVFQHADESIAITPNRLQEDRVIPVTLNQTEFTFVQDETLNTPRLYKTNGNNTIEHTNSSYVYNGEAYSAADLPLPEEPAYDAFWFAWAAFNPNTELYE